MRADAKRNLAKIMDAAAEVVAERGVGAPMELLARRAGVGVGTLYRRFPDRDALIAALGGHYIDTLSQALDRAAANPAGAWAGVREFVLWCAEPGRTAFNSALAGPAADAIGANPDFTAAVEGVWARLDVLVRRAQSGGAMRADFGAGDVMALLNVFTCHPAELPAQVSAQPGRYLSLMLDGMAVRDQPTPAGGAVRD
ncbi:MAG: TetR/AcrR family transcriptional regulator [Nonomuraea sp.]|nr:TetR/AcrR family transcriptional regulator [Nonomuraea sp.]